MLMRFSFLVCLATLVSASWLAMSPATAERAFPQTPPSAEDSSLVIVVNKTNPVENISSNDLRSLFLAELKTWSNGRRVTIVMREPGQPERIAMLKAVCRMTDSDYIKYFMQAQFTGDLQATPKVLATSVGMRKFVFNVPGAIGYARASEVDDSVKIVRIDGRLPGDAGYKLRLVSSRPRG
jgi:ABC-type phosphate transport system substrate-binding protein